MEAPKVRLSEAVVFLTKARLADPRSGQQEMAKAERWQELLGDVSLAEAMDALDGHQRESTVPVLPAHVLERVRIARQRARRPIEQQRQRAELTEWNARKPFTDDELAEAQRVFDASLADARAARAARESNTGVHSPS